MPFSLIRAESVVAGTDRHAFLRDPIAEIELSGAVRQGEYILITAVDARIRVDLILICALGYGVYGTFALTCAAGDACVCYLICHCCVLLSCFIYTYNITHTF